MRKRVLLVDASPLIYANFDALNHLSSRVTGESTGLRYGFTRSVRSYESRLEVDKTIICFDLMGPVRKAEGITEYKSDRIWTAKKQEMYDQVPDLRELLSLTKWTQVEAEGYEADDVIGTLARKLAEKDADIFIVSPDRDLWQLVTDRVVIFNPKAKIKKEWFIGQDDVERHFGVPPDILLHLKALTGDKSDNLSGAILPRFEKGWAKSLKDARKHLPKEFPISQGRLEDLSRFLDPLSSPKYDQYLSNLPSVAIP